MTTQRTAAVLRRGLRAVHWYLREVTGESEYDRYLTHQAQVHGASACVLTRREFERKRWEEKGSTPGNRCC
jgi:uncharacterized short protein YbdD (DUF466 family)